MVVDTNKESININKIVFEKKEMIFVQGDMIVPDSKPDILSTIDTSGNLCIYKKEIMDGKIKIEGNVAAYIMYLSENAEDSARGIHTSLDFSETIVAPNCKEDMLLETNLTIKNIECNVINGRKINVKVGIETKIKVYSNESIGLINGISNNGDIQTLENKIKLNSLVGSGNTKVYVKDTIMIDNTDNLAEILKVNINMVDKDIKTSYNKVLAKSEAEVKIIYLTEENKIATVTNKIPIVGFIDIQNVLEENICDINFETRNMIIKPNNVEEHSIYVELEVEVSCIVYEEKEINIIQDLYSPIENVICGQKQVTIMCNKERRRETCYVKNNVNIPEIENGNLIDADIQAIIVKENKLNSRIMYEGELNINFVFTTATSKNINTKTITTPFEYVVENIENGENLNLETQLEVGKQDFIIQNAGNINCEVDIIFDIAISQNMNLDIIDKVEVEENRDLEDYSIIIYIVKPGDTLWKIAKKFKSTVEDIVKTNAIENPDAIYPGEKLYIPKYFKTNTKEPIPTVSYE